MVLSFCSRAQMIGRGNYDKKLVITNSHFDSKTPVVPGRYHHDAQFFTVSLYDV